MSAVLEVRNLSVRYNRIVAVDDVSLALAQGDVVAVLGANGAGKSSLLKAIIGAVKPAAGQVLLNGEDIAAWPPSRRVARGLALVPEGRRILISMSVHENLLMGAFCRRDAGAVKQEIAALYERFPNLARRQHMQASLLSGGEQQMLAIGRALLARPTVLMLDEPSLGLSPLLVTELFYYLEELGRRDGMSLLLVEQNTRKALQIASRGYVFELGRLVLAGAPAELLANQALQDAYLGRAGAPLGSAHVQ